jgi:hypothetical protein
MSASSTTSRAYRVRLVVALAVAGLWFTGRDNEKAPVSDGTELAAAVNKGPVAGGGGDPGTLCMPSSDGGAATYSIDKLENTANDDAIIEKVTVNEAENVKVLGIDVVPLSGSGTAGAPGYPPDPKLYRGTGFEWADRAPATGAVLAPGDRSSVAIGLQLKTPTDSGSFLNLDVLYRVGDDTYQLTTSTKFMVAPAGRACNTTD